MSNTEIKPVSRNSNLVIRELKQETLIYDSLIDKAFCLNETSSLVWNLCNGKNSVSDVSIKLAQKFKSQVSEDVVWLALDQLKKQNLLENGEEVAIDFNGLSRREVILKIGLASTITLPIAASIIAPMGVNAASRCISPNLGGGFGCSCTANSQCPGNTTTRCCSRVPGSPRTCVTANTLRDTGESCGNNCDCISDNCVGPVGNGTCN